MKKYYDSDLTPEERNPTYRMWGCERGNRWIVIKGSEVERSRDGSPRWVDGESCYFNGGDNDNRCKGHHTLKLYHETQDHHVVSGWSYKMPFPDTATKQA
jgi:hypothetical protein